MVTKGRVEPFKAFWEREGGPLGGVDARVPERDATLLQLAARAGQEEMTHFLLDELRADPTVPVADGEGADDPAAGDSDASDAPQPMSGTSRRVAYDLGATRGVRNVFRRCAAAHPDWWDWLGAARVPSMLSREMEAEREERRKGRRKVLKDKIRERQARQEETVGVLVVEAEPVPVSKTMKPQAAVGPKRLGGSAGGQEGVIGLSPEMAAKVERERRARAAEARLKAFGGRQ